MRNNYFKLTFAIITASVITFLSPDSYALSFGKLRVDSELGQPLRLQIPLESVTDQEAETLDITLGTREDFQRAGVEYPDIASLLEIEMVTGSDGRYHVEISTRDPVQEPYLHVLLSAIWAGGKAIREYTALLDPPMYTGSPVADVTLPGSSDSASASEGDGAAAAVAAEIEAAVAAAEQAEATSIASGGSASSQGTSPSGTDQIVVHQGDTLSQLVANLARPVGINHIQALEAVFRKNPGAFINDNMNLLRSGATLQVPTFDEMQSVSRQESIASYTAQLEAFNEYRNISADQPEDTSSEVAETPQEEGDQLAVATPLPPLTEEGLEELEAEPETRTAESAGQTAAEQPAVDEEQTEPVAEAEVTTPAPQEVEEPRLTIGQQEAGTATEEGTGVDSDSDAQLETLRSQLAQLDESLLASGVESSSVRQNLEQIQDQVERISSLVQIEDENLAQAQSRAADSDTATSDTDPMDSAEMDSAATEESGESGEVAREAATGEETDNIVAGETEQDLSGSSSVASDAPAESVSDVSDDGFTSVESAVDPEASVEQELSNEPEQSVAASEAPQDSVQEEVTPAPGTEMAQETVESGDEENTAQLVAAEPVDGEPDTAATTDSDNQEEESSAAAAVRKVASGNFFGSVLDSVKGVFSSLTEHGLKIALGLLALIGGLFLWQRRKSQHEYDASMLDIETEEVSSNSSEASIQRMSKGSGIDLASANDSALELTIGGGMSYLSEEGIAGVNEEDNEVIKAGEVDPLAEADVYLAYDRDEQAIQVLKEAFADTPERGELAEKLLEIYHKQDDRRSFDGLAAEMQRRKSSTNDFSWDKVAAMGREVSPDNPLYESDGSPSSVSDESTTIDFEDGLLDELEDSTNSESVSRTVDDSIDVDQLKMLGDVSENTEVRGLEADDLEFDIEKEVAGDDKKTDDLDAPTLSQIINENLELDSKELMENATDSDDPGDQVDEDTDDDISLGGDDITLVLGDDEKFNQIEEEARRIIADKGETSQEDDDSDDDLAIDAHSGVSDLSESSMTKLEPYHESETALELAKAYLELGEQEIAKGFIEEVLTEGSDKQKGKARELIKELAS